MKKLNQFIQNFIPLHLSENESFAEFDLIWRWRLWIYISYVVGVITTLLFILRFLTEGILHSSIFIFPVYSILMFYIFPIWAKKYESFVIPCVLSIASGACLILYRFYINGGPDSATIYWLATAPILFTMLFGRQGAILSLAIQLPVILWIFNLPTEAFPQRPIESNLLRFIVMLLPTFLNLVLANVLDRQRVITFQQLERAELELKLLREKEIHHEQTRTQAALQAALQHEINNPLAIAFANLEVLSRNKMNAQLSQLQLKMNSIKEILNQISRKDL